jgi:hypothetical protein
MVIMPCAYITTTTSGNKYDGHAGGGSLRKKKEALYPFTWWL